MRRAASSLMVGQQDAAFAMSCPAMDSKVESETVRMGLNNRIIPLVAAGVLAAAVALRIIFIFVECTVSTLSPRGGVQHGAALIAGPSMSNLQPRSPIGRESNSGSLTSKHPLPFPARMPSEGYRLLGDPLKVFGLGAMK